MSLGMAKLSLQWTNVSSKSKTKVILSNYYFDRTLITLFFLELYLFILQIMWIGWLKVGCNIYTLVSLKEMLPIHATEVVIH